MKTIQTEQKNLSRYDGAIAASADFPLDAILTELRQRFEALYGDYLRHVVLFGSRARGDAAPDSDVDVLVVLDDIFMRERDTEAELDIIASLSLHYDTVIACIFKLESAYQESGSPLMLNVRREGIPI